MPRMIDDLDQQEDRKETENGYRVQEDCQQDEQIHPAQEQDAVQANARCNAEQEEQGSSELLRLLLEHREEDDRNDAKDQRYPRPWDRSAEDLEVVVGQQCCCAKQHIHQGELWRGHPLAKACPEPHPARNGWRTRSVSGNCERSVLSVRHIAWHHARPALQALAWQLLVSCGCSCPCSLRAFLPTSTWGVSRATSRPNGSAIGLSVRFH